MCCIFLWAVAFASGAQATPSVWVSFNASGEGLGGPTIPEPAEVGDGRYNVFESTSSAPMPLFDNLGEYAGRIEWSSRGQEYTRPLPPGGEWTFGETLKGFIYSGGSMGLDIRFTDLSGQFREGGITPAYLVDADGVSVGDDGQIL